METETRHALCAAMSAATRAKDARVDLLAYDPAFTSATRAELLAAVVAAVIDEASAWARALAAEARKALNDALSGEADAVRRAESAELGCEIAYKREPTQAEGDAHEYRHDQSMGASECIRECHVPMGNHHGHRCLCGRWVWGGPTVCQRCVDADPKFYSARTKHAVNSGAREGMAEARGGTMPGSGIPLPHPHGQPTMGGVAGDHCGPGNECGRLGCPECQQ